MHVLFFSWEPYFFLKKLTDSSFCCPAIALLWLTKLNPCQFSTCTVSRWSLSILPAGLPWEGRMPTSVTDEHVSDWRWVSWQTWGHTPGRSWEHDRGQGGASVRWGWPAGEVRQTHTSHLWALLLEITRKSDPHMTPGRGETLKSSHVVVQRNTHTTVLMTLHFHLHFCFKKTVPLKQ